MHARGAAWHRRSLVVVLLLIAALMPLNAAAQGGTTYEVQAGDSLGYIAATYGTTVDAIIQANGLASGDTIWPGQKLTIPLPSAPTPGVQSPAPGQAPSSGNTSGSAGSSNRGNTYTVQLGDTLASIARDLGVSQSALATANNLTNPDLLWIGQPLLIPGTALGNAALAAPPSAVTQGDRYVVQPGDTLNSIAAGLGVSTADLMQANNLTNADLLLVGQKLVIPGQGGASSVANPTVPPQPTALPAVVATPLPPAPLPTATPAVAPAAGPTEYTVQPGDTLNSIAAQLGVSAADLLRANNIDNADVLSVGQKLRVPLADGSVPAAQPSLTAVPAAMATPVPTLYVPAITSSVTDVVTSPVRPATATPPPWAQQQTGQLRYVVESGDTLGSIARQYNTTAAQIARVNHLPSPDLVSVGMTLMIPAPAWTAPDLAGKPSRFVASIALQRCWLYQGNTIVANWPCSTGRPGTDTHPGSYRVQSKMDKAFGSTWNIWMPYWLGIYWAGASENGIHGIPYDKDSGWKLWEGYVGTPITYGCILLDQEHAKQLYDLAYIGMPVIVQR
jgi:LysM repeat protein